MRIFLACPSDLLAEREIVRMCVDEHKARRGDDSKVIYEVVGWEQVRGTARRPQAAINELIAESHFLIAMFRERWGSEPGSPWGYTSGTEEELFNALIELARTEQPMRDVWVVFLEHDTPDRRIAQLREQMSEQHSVMYEPIAGHSDLKYKLAERLRTWELLADHKVPQLVNLTPSSGKEVLRAAILRTQGEALVDLGQPEAGRNLLHEAAVVGGPLEDVAYAKFLGRHGDLAEAFTWTQRAIDHFTSEGSSLYSTLAAEAFAAQAGVMRRQARDMEAIGRLETALTLIHQADPYSMKVRCRILDDLGLARQAIHDLEGAGTAFEEALELRRHSGDQVGVSQSLVNLARLDVRREDLDAAVAKAEDVLDQLHGLPLLDLRANANLLVAQVRLRQGRADEGLSFAAQSLVLNRQIASRRGEAKALLLLAQCSRATGRLAEAAEHARGCLTINEEMGDQFGANKARWILDQLAARHVT